MAFLEDTNALWDAVLAIAGCPAERALAGMGIVESPTALHLDCEKSTEMKSECTSVIWAVGTPRLHHVVEWGLTVLADHETACIEKPKLHLHGTEAAVDGEDWGRSAIGAFEGWRTSSKQKRKRKQKQ